MQSGAEADSTLDAGQGRIERRTCQATDRLTFLDGKEEWVGLKSIVKITSERIDKRSGYSGTRLSYYIALLEAKPVQIARTVRSHWAIENNLHWTFDVWFKEDAALRNKGNAALNYQIMTKMVLAMVERESKA